MAKKKPSRNWIETISRTYGTVHMVLRIKKNGHPRLEWVGDKGLVSLPDRERAVHLIRAYFNKSHDDCYYMIWPLTAREPEPNRMIDSAKGDMVCLS